MQDRQDLEKDTPRTRVAVRIMAILGASILCTMLVVLALLAGARSAPDIADLDRLARSRDVAGLTRFLAPLPSGTRNPLNVLRTGGAYDVGRFGWRALEGKAPGGQTYVVLTTALTSEDVGELVFQRAGERLRYVPETDDLGVRVVRHAFDLTFDPPRKTARLRDRCQFVNRQGTGTFLFRMSSQYRVSKITDVAGKPVPYEQIGGTVLLNRPQGRDFRFDIQYQAVVDLPRYAGSVGPREATLTNDYWYPMIARRPAAYDLTVRSPKGWTVVGQGVQTEMKEDAQGRTTRFRMDLPVVYYSVSTAPYRTFSQKIEGLRFSTWSMRLPEADMRAQTEFYAPILRYYEQFGKFPFDGYGALDSEVYGGGALEAYSFTTWGGGLPHEDAHEPAHTWWGGLVNNTYLKSFWNESFAVFSDGLYHRNVPIGNVEERRLAFVQDANPSPVYNQFACAEAGADVGPAASALGYGKGAQVLQMLEQILGTAKTIETMRQWVQRHPKGEPGEWEDYERVAKDLAPEAKLGTFFRDWLHRPGYPKLKIEDTSWNDGFVTFTLGFEGEGYDMPLEVLLQYPDGSRILRTVRGKKGDVVRIESKEKPALVSIDPYRRALREYRPDETPVELRGVLSQARRYTDPSQPGFLKGLLAGKTLDKLPPDLNGVFLVGSPETLPAMRPLCAKVGFRVVGNKLSYEGSTIDLTKSAALAVVDLGDGKKCVIGLGTTRAEPDFGRARLVLVDDLGRFLRGRTEPKTSGYLTFRL
jgi:hypothetical protein